MPIYTIEMEILNKYGNYVKILSVARLNLQEELKMIKNLVKRTLATAIITLGIATSAHAFTAEDAIAAPDITVMVDGKTVEFDVPPQIVNGRTLLPFRAVAEAMGIEVEWNGETKEISFPATSGFTWIVTIGDVFPRSIDAPANVVVYPMDAPALIVDGRAMVPARFVADQRGKKVAWDDETRTVYIGYDPRNEFTDEQAREFELEVFRLTNIEREKAGLVPVIWDEDLARAARKHAEDMSINIYFSHTGLDGSESEDRVARETDRFGYVGENLHRAGSSTTTPEAVVQSWMNSGGHRAQILSNVDQFGDDHYLGVGFSNIDGRAMVVQKFSSIQR